MRLVFAIALGIAASKAAGLRKNFGTMTKPLHAGEAARSGIESAQWAQRGFTADRHVLDAQFNYFEVFAGESEFDAEAVEYLIQRHYKPVNRPYRCCHPRDILLQIKNLCLYQRQETVLTRDNFDFAVENYFAVM